MSALGYIRYVDRYFVKIYPIEVTYFITGKCNFRCKHCFNWQTIEKATSKKELTIDEVKKITKKFPNFLRLSLSGGEPFIRNDMPEICYQFYKNCNVKHISIPTNASMPNRIVKMTEEILRRCSGAYINVSLSLDAIGGKRDKFVGVKNTFPKFEETFQKLKKLKKKYRNFGLGVITTQTKYNEKDLKKIYDYATKKLEVDNFGFNVVRGSPRYPIETDVNMKIYAEMAETLRKAVKEEGRKFNFPFVNMFLAKKSLLYKIVLKTQKDKKFQISCYAGRLRCVIDETGNLFPCETLMFDRKGFAFGNFKDFNYDFKKLWFSNRAKKIRKWIKDSKCFCTHECDLTTNILFNFKLLPLLYKEWKEINQ